MDKHYTYLLINILTFFFPVVLSFDKKVRFGRNWKFIFPGLLITGAIFLVWDYLFTLYDVWSFNPGYITGVYVANLPLEELLFFITVPFACLFIYECLNYYFKKSIPRSFGTAITVLMLSLSAIMLLLFYQRVYSLITFGSLLLISAFLLIRKPWYLSRFYLAYFVSLFPFYIVNGILTALPVVMYNDAENCGFRIGTIPFEDHFYSLSMLLINAILFEHFRGRQTA